MSNSPEIRTKHATVNIEELLTQLKTLSKDFLNYDNKFDNVGRFVMPNNKHKDAPEIDSPDSVVDSYPNLNECILEIMSNTTHIPSNFNSSNRVYENGNEVNGNEVNGNEVNGNEVNGNEDYSDGLVVTTYDNKQVRLLPDGTFVELD